MKRFLLTAIAAFTFAAGTALLVHAKADAATCNVASTGLSIANYNVFAAADQIIPEAPGVLTVHCSNLNTGTTTVKIGVSGANSATTYANPAITLGTNTLSYTLTLPGNSSLTWNLTNLYQQNVSPNGGGNANFNVPAFNLDVVALQDVGVGTTYGGQLYFTVTCTGASAC